MPFKSRSLVVLVVITVFAVFAGAGALGGCRSRPPGPNPVTEPPETTGPALKVVGTFPLPGMTDVPEEAGVVITFDPATTVDPAAMAKRAAFQPAVEGSWEVYGSAERLVFKPDPATGFSPLTAYTLTIAEAVWGTTGAGKVPGSSGSSPAQPFALTFRTGTQSWPTLAFPAWSPDSRSLAVLIRPPMISGSRGTAAYDLSLITLGKPGLPRLAEGAQPWQRPVWTADGQGVVFARAGATPDGKYAPDEVWLAKPGDPPTAGRLIPAADYAEPMWLAAQPAPDGSGYVVVANYGGVDAHSDVMQSLFIADQAGRKVRAVSTAGGTQHFLGWVGDGGDFLFLETYDRKNQGHNFAYDIKLGSAALNPGSGIWQGPSPQPQTLITGGPVVGYAGGGGSESGSTFALTTWKAYDTGLGIPHLPADLYLLVADKTAAGGYTLRKVDLPGAAAWAAPSPDGSQVAFACNAEGNWDLWVIDVADTLAGRGQPRRLTSTPDDDLMPAWSPDGRWIAFVLRHRGGGHHDGAELKLVSPAGGELFDCWAVK